MPIPTTTKQYVLSKIGSLDNLKTKESLIRSLKPAEVLVRVRAVSLNYRDLAIAKGLYGGDMIIQKDLVPCSDYSGEIALVGEDAQGKWKPGDRVCCNFAQMHVDGNAAPEAMSGGPVHGVLSQYVICPAEGLGRIPAHLSFEEASTLPCAALTAYSALLGPIPVKAGDYVLIQGTGGVSIFGLQFAVASGATVIATSSSDEKLKLASELGANYLINYKTTPDWEEAVKTITNGRGVDHVIEVGGPGTLLKSLQSIKHSGWVHMIGFLAQGDDASLVGPIIGKAAHLRGVLIGSVTQFNNMLRLISTHGLRPVIGKVFPFDQALDAFRYLESQVHVGKVVIKVD
ncbi:hypothetical protein EYR40_004992 [Pleurotus pulmonarius]|nr:hypothetical protein EYR36_006630 [Pleurotus pulmonarius]KAF4601326.1 hypothetical protein EYR38_005978 [Pleurotus pulmonarius]KAF4601792.1 hypothetical protein EYR40_004992 [Pleurotus pulmonarius]